MATWNEILNRLRYMGGRSQFDEELDDEIRFHIESRAEELEADGMPAKAAMERARREFGSRARMAEDTRGAWQIQWLEDFWRDLCYGARMAAKSPGFTAVAVLSLALGVGANCGMFTFVDAILLRPPAIPRPGEIVIVHESSLDAGTSPASWLDYLDLRDQSRSFDGLMAFANVTIGFAARPGAVAHTKDGQMVSANYFDVLGSKPVLGRGFLPEENAVPGRDAVVILSHALWESEFHSDPGVLKKQVWLGGIPFAVVGVMPARFSAVDDDLTDSDAEYFVPLMMAPRIGSDPDILTKRDNRDLTLVGRLNPGVEMRQARAEVSAIAANLGKQYPETNRNREMTVQTALNYRTTGFGGYIGVTVMMMACAVFLVACANVAGLLSSRAASRSQEVAVRLTVGAGRSRVIRQLLTESILLAAGGCAAGLAIGYVPVLLLKRLVHEVAPEESASISSLGVDERVVMFAIAVALLSVLIFGLAPAFRATRTDLSSAMKGGFAVPARRGIFRDWLRGRNLLVTAQVAISLFLLTISGFIYVGLGTMLDTVKDPGFRSDHVFMMTFDPVVARYEDAQARQFYLRLMERLRMNDGIRSVALASPAQTTTIQAEGYRPADASGAADGASVPAIWAGENFFEALAIPILRGRGFGATDSSHGPDVAVVNDEFGKFFWPGQNAVGKRIRIESPKPRWVSVVGVASIKQYEGMIQAPPPKLLFLPAEENPKQLQMTLYARFTGDLAARVGALRSAVREVDPVQAVPDIRHWGSRMEGFRRALELASRIVASMGVIGVFLALVGLYGLVAFDVGRRTREIGVRMALGARRGSLLRMVLRQALVLAICGMSGGLLLKNGADSVFLAYLPPNKNQGGGVNFDFGNGAVAMLALAVLVLTMLAAYVPARRAASVDPSVALRAE